MHENNEVSIEIKNETNTLNIDIQYHENNN